MEKLVKQIIDIFSSLQNLSWPKNWFLRLVSLLFAIFLWYFVAGEDKVDVNVIIPVEIVNIPRNLVISNQFKKQLDVTISGPRGLVRGLSNQHISRSIDLSNATPGTFVVRNDEDSIPFPRGIRTLRVQPSHMTLLLDSLVHQDLPIKPVTRGKPAEGFELNNITLTPATITVNGPKSILGNQVFLPTKPIDIGQLKEPAEMQVALDLEDAVAELIGESVVTARINISEKIVKKTFTNVFVDFDHSAERTTYIITPNKVSVDLELPFGMGNSSIDLNEQIKAKVDAGNLSPGEYQLAISVTPPPRTKMIKVMPEKVSITISHPKPAKKRKPTPE
ncbi:MAG: YbbR-like domain-containing protein [Proteobacteria bacterium]|nr:YbbR-like domain-containing protein [Pseudomonadota bacterium]MBU1710607.1 YbbR-like domain-containing protein [Pseudomonadota bacterium]